MLLKKSKKKTQDIAISYQSDNNLQRHVRLYLSISFYTTDRKSSNNKSRNDHTYDRKKRKTPSTGLSIYLTRNNQYNYTIKNIS